MLCDLSVWDEIRKADTEYEKQKEKQWNPNAMRNNDTSRLMIASIQ